MKKKMLKGVPCARPVINPSSSEDRDNSSITPEWFYPTPTIKIKELPTLRLKDGSLWKEGVGFLISRLYDLNFNRTCISLPTVSRKADDLAFYMKALDELQIEYSADERFRINRPTYAFTSLLKDRVESGQLSDSSAPRILSTVQEFHRWYDFQFRPQRMYPLWEELTRTRTETDDKGVLVALTYTTTDLMESIRKAKSPRDPNFIIDDGKLKPLTEEQQKITIGALYESKNTEMILGFLIALSSSARIQTAYTLRAQSFSRKISEKQEVVRVHTGKSTGVDTKRNKSHYLDIPAWLYKKIHVYISSERYLIRAEKSLMKNVDRYVFYTEEGNPYYSSREDSVSESRDGSAIRVYMTEQLFPRIARLGHSFRFRFHDLRASYCMNRLDEGLESVERGEATLDGVLRGIQDAMGHSDIKTTYRYLDYRSFNPIINSVNKAWTGKLLADIVRRLDEQQPAD